MSLLSRFAARTPEEAARRQFGLWAGLALVVLLPLWWLWGADAVAGVLRPVVGLALRLFGLTGRIDVVEDGWSIGTRLTQAGQAIDFPLSESALRRLLLSFPLAAAFLIAPPRPIRPWRAAGISLLVLSLVFAVSVPLVVWGAMAPMLGPDHIAPTASMPFTPDQSALHPLIGQVTVIGRYVALSIAPLLAALLLWAMLNPAGMRTLVAEIKD